MNFYELDQKIQHEIREGLWDAIKTVGSDIGKGIKSAYTDTRDNMGRSWKIGQQQIRNLQTGQQQRADAKTAELEGQPQPQGNFAAAMQGGQNTQEIAAQIAAMQQQLDSLTQQLRAAQS